MIDLFSTSQDPIDKIVIVRSAFVTLAPISLQSPFDDHPVSETTISRSSNFNADIVANMVSIWASKKLEYLSSLPASTTPRFSRNRAYVVQLDDFGVRFVSEKRVSVHHQVRAGLAEALQHWEENRLDELLPERPPLIHNVILCIT
ncbi:unnamed protein product [Linum trigynum]|uniref:Uncharacterized protein n=1 Tax=Linum trigynum TaxID=586398 RepID=A0AAV2GGE9_9ROSI